MNYKLITVFFLTFSVASTQNYCVAAQASVFNEGFTGSYEDDEVENNNRKQITCQSCKEIIKENQIVITCQKKHTCCTNCLFARMENINNNNSYTVHGYNLKHCTAHLKYHIPCPVKNCKQHVFLILHTNDILFRPDFLTHLKAYFLQAKNWIVNNKKKILYPVTTGCILAMLHAYQRCSNNETCKQEINSLMDHIIDSLMKFKLT